VPRISAFYGIVILMWFDDHPLPHFHAEYAEYQAKISIDNLDVVKGTLPPRALRLVREWGVQHRDELMENWHRARAREPLEKIDPLS
jgi:hypothetical protein